MIPADYRPQDFQWSQRDQRWSWKRLGSSGLTVGGYGCAGVGINYWVNRAWQKLGINRFARPGEFFDFANQHHFFDPTGKIYWNVADAFSANKLFNTLNPKEAWATMMEVQWGHYLHWLPLLNGNLCLNPWTGHIEPRNQPIWKPTGKYKYFAL